MPRSPVSYGASLAARVFFSAAFRPEVWPTTRSSPSSSVRARISEPTVPSALPGRQPTTTASIVRTRLILDMPTRLPGSYAASWRLAITPSRSSSHGSASAGSSVVGVSWTGSATTASRRSAALASAAATSNDSSSNASRSKRDEDGRRLLGEHVDARLGRVDALAERVEVLAALGVEEDDLAVEDVAPGGKEELREVAAQRLAAARLDVDVRAVDEGDGAETVPFGLVRPTLAGRQVLGRPGELGEQWWLEGQRHGCPKP